MTDSENNEMDFIQMAEQARQQIMSDELNDPDLLTERVYQLWRRWADFELYIVSPTIDVIFPPLRLMPELISGSNSGVEEREFVYPIQDFGYKLVTSKGLDMSGMSMCKLFFTIEKMIYLLIERLKSGGIESEVEVQVAFGGHEIAQRKAFESVINLSYNVVVTNFDPGAWGEMYLQNIKRIADKGYGYPSETPRVNFRIAHNSTPVPGG
ncbi:virulence factor [Legionella sp. CNM-4043-24]|uniref:virulence factor n=1 Tax=Legionella sp. CNM-4043-24 TaxID=3421646 RepID=UPI00403AB235